MKVFALQVRSLSGTPWSAQEAVILKQKWQELEKTYDFLKSVRQRGADFLKRVRQQRQQYAQTVQQRWLQWEKENQQQAQQQIESACQRAIDETIEWHEQMADLEQKIFSKFRQRALLWAIELIEKKIPEIGLSAALAHNLEDYLSGEPEGLIGTLEVHSEDEAGLKHWGTIFPNLRVAVCSDLKSGSARLITEFFTVHLSVGEMLDKILSQLNQFLNDQGSSALHDSEKASLLLEKKEQPALTVSEDTDSSPNLTVHPSLSQQTRGSEKPSALHSIRDSKRAKAFRHHALKSGL